jgi:hypothetical protein
MPVSSSDLALEASRVGIALALSLWIGGTFLAAAAAAKIFRTLPSRDQAGRLFGDILSVLDKAKFIAAGALLVGVLLEVQVLGSTLPHRRIARDAVLFLLVAAHVWAVMVVQPRMRYYREKIADFDATPADDPWRLKFQAQHERSTRANVLGLFLAVVAVFLT